MPRRPSADATGRERVGTVSVVIERWRRQPAVVQDLVLAVVLGAAWFALAAYWESRGWRPRHGDIWDLAGLASALALGLRRWAPPPVAVLVVLAYPVLYDVPLQSDFHLLPVLVIAYAAAGRGSAGAVGMAASSLAAGGLLSTGWLHRSDLMPAEVDWSTVLFHQFAIGAVVLLGWLADAQRRSAAALRSVEAERAVSVERTRIARELHDDLAHHLTALVVRAQALQRVSPESGVAADDMGWVADTARYALSSVRRTVEVLRDDAPASLAPGPTLADIPSVVARVEEAGLSVDLDVERALPPLDPQVQHAVVRVVQESLTNVLRHAGASAARVVLRGAGSGVAAVIDDDGAGPGPESVGRQGLGLTGMRERAVSCGGWLEVGRGPLGGWRVEGWFPASSQGRAAR
jgi:signal transduction histidine kinase